MQRVLFCSSRHVPGTHPPGGPQTPPQQVPIDSTISFGASTRTYTIREKPQTQGAAGTGEGKAGEDEELKGLLGLPEEETELEVSSIHTRLQELGSW